ncbi:MAG TPA: GNAT family N-acetyltransferase [Egibacteraceae bacterium]|nr:GNAT family N-acetyltransferase [Egibacteraceae bacterium]
MTSPPIPASVGHLPAILQLLESEGLPVQGLGRATLWVVDDSRGLVAVVGLEALGSVGLLRSLCVAPRRRGTGMGGTLIEHVAAAAEQRGVTDLFLLTTDRARFFERRGFTQVELDQAPRELDRFQEYREQCPGDAALLHRLLQP